MNVTKEIKQQQQQNKNKNKINKNKKTPSDAKKSFSTPLITTKDDEREETSLRLGNLTERGSILV